MASINLEMKSGGPSIFLHYLTPPQDNQPHLPMGYLYMLLAYPIKPKLHFLPISRLYLLLETIHKR